MSTAAPHPPAAARPEGRGNLLLALAGGLLLGFAFPPSPFYTLAYAGFIPLFVLFERMRTWGETVRSFYFALLVFHLVTVYWTGGFTHMRDPWMMAAGGALLILHPFFYLPSILCARLVRARLGLFAGVTAFALFWLAFEFVHSLGEFSFPWVTIGNSQALDLPRSQIAEWTSALGLSALVLAFNGLAFVLMVKLSAREWTVRSRPALTAGVLLLLLYTGPWVYGEFRMAHVDTWRGPTVRVGMVQPDVDPWKKWGDATTSKTDAYRQELERHLSATRTFASQDPDLVIWCETAMPFHLLHPRYEEMRLRLNHALDSLRFPVFTGLPTVQYFSAANAPVTADRIEGSDVYAQAYNSAVVFHPDGTIGPVYRKVVLVPFAERIPYASALSFLIEPLRWNVGISSWGKGTDPTVHRIRTRSGDTARFGGMICYESVYPAYVREFTKRGAEFLVVITNDSWWGNTSGAYQHAAYASLRAIENRRWVVQCSNGGITLIVRPSGRVELATRMHEQVNVAGVIERQTVETPYVRHGDVFGTSVLFGSGLLLAAAIARPFWTKLKGMRNP